MEVRWVGFWSRKSELAWTIGIILKYTNPSFVKEERYVYCFGTTVE
jgi:hypothetical protein